MKNKHQEDSLPRMLKDKTLSVYALLLTHGPLGVRDVQRRLRLSSPSLAGHHLGKLVDLDLIEKSLEGQYFVKKNVKIGSLSIFVKVGDRLLPRLIFMLFYLLMMLVLYCVFFISWPLAGYDIMIISIIIVSGLVLAYETVQLYRLGPF